jgi:glycosyltransferase involved in cell wall biosynthesis
MLLYRVGQAISAAGQALASLGRPLYRIAATVPPTGTYPQPAYFDPEVARAGRKGRASRKRQLLIVGARSIAAAEGGVEKFAEEFASRLPEHCQATILCLEGQQAPAPDRVGIVPVPRWNAFRTDKVFYFTHSLYLYATRRYDCVLILGINFALLVLLMRLIFWRRATIVVRSGSIDHLLDKWGAATKLFIQCSESMLRLADGVIAVAPNIQQHLTGRGISSQMIRNGLERTTALTSSVERHRKREIVAVGRVTPQKNYRVLIEAADLLKNSDLQVRIIGGPDLSGEHDRLLALLNSRRGTPVTFHGRVARPQVLQYLSEAALFVNTSHHEGMSNAVLEAIQQGTPILLSDIEANRDLGLPERFYFDRHSSQALADSIQAALINPAEYVVSPDHFDSWETVIDNVHAYMERV